MSVLGQKLIENAKNAGNFTRQTKSFGPTELPERILLKGQILVKNA